MLKYLFFLLSFTRSYCDVLNTSNVNILKEHLLSDYRADTIPTQSEPLNLSIGIAVRAFNNIDQKEGIVSLNLWLRYRWNDYNFKWNGKNQLGKNVPAGMYFFEIYAGDFRQTKKMILLK